MSWFRIISVVFETNIKHEFTFSPYQPRASTSAEITKGNVRIHFLNTDNYVLTTSVLTSIYLFYDNSTG